MTHQKLFDHMSQEKKMIKTLKEYAKEKGLSRQRIYKIQDRLQVIELPIFAEYNGEKHEIGRQKFVVEKKV